jgi:hypothetical protein
MKTIRYIGHKEEVYTVWQGSPFKFARGIEVEVPAELADSLLAQPDKFEEVS